VRYFRYNPHSREVNREFPKVPQPLILAGGRAGAEYANESTEIRPAAGSSSGIGSHSSGTRAPARTRSTIVSLMKAGYTAARRGSTAVARPAAAPAVEGTSAQLDVLHFPDLQMVVVCKRTSAEVSAGVQGGVDMASRELWDFLLFTRSCLEFKMLSGVQELPVEN
jgi:hypothetical protein